MEAQKIKMSNSGYRLLNPGDIIGERYQIEKHLGGGGFAVTYLAQDINLPNRPSCVVKQLRPMFRDPWILEDAKQRFVQEAEMQRRLGNHPQIPQLLAYFEENEELYLVQEFIEGEVLDKEISKKQLNETEVIALLKDVLTVLDFVHRQSAIHRDIKPSNLIRRKSDDKIVLIDFGAAKEIGTLVFDPEIKATFTRAIGTPGYMPPEQYMGRPNPIYASDIYALGKTAIYALTKQEPRDLEDTATGEIKDWQKTNPDNTAVSHKLAFILNKMIRPNASERYQSAREVLSDLEPLIKVGKKIGDNYKIIRYLGGGIWGHTYLAENLQQTYQSPCVIKQLKPQTLDPKIKQQIEQRFDTEIAVLQRLGDHDQIPKLWDRFSENQEFYLVQEYINGEDLSKELRKGKRLSEKDVIRLLKDVLTVLDFIHRNGVIHRDIKPSNLIRRNSDGKFFLIDFGIVKEIVTLSESTSKPRSSTQPVGTEGYMSPEQMVGKPVYASDIYALGTTAFQALTGKAPEDLVTNPETAEVILEKGQVSKELANILNKMVSLELTKRYNSAEKVIRDLQKIGAGPGPIIPFIKWGAIILGTFLLVLSPFMIKAINLRMIFAKGNEYYNAEKSQLAIDEYDKVTSKDANFHEAWTNKGFAYGRLASGSIADDQKNSYYNKMLDSCRVATNVNDESILAWMCLGEAYKSLNMLDEAITSLNKAIQIDPQDPAIWINRGEAFLINKEPENALPDLEQAIQLLGNVNDQNYLSSVAWYMKGWALRDLKNFERALEAYNKSLQYDPNYFFAQLGKGISLRGLQQYPQALSTFKDMLNNPQLTDKEKIQTLYWYGLTLCDSGMTTEGIDAFDQVLLIDSNHQSSIDAKNNCRN